MNVKTEEIKEIAKERGITTGKMRRGRSSELSR